MAFRLEAGIGGFRAIVDSARAWATPRRSLCGRALCSGSFAEADPTSYPAGLRFYHPTRIAPLSSRGGLAGMATFAAREFSRSDTGLNARKFKGHRRNRPRLRTAPGSAGHAQNPFEGV